MTIFELREMIERALPWWALLFPLPIALFFWLFHFISADRAIKKQSKKLMTDMRRRRKEQASKINKV